MTAPAGVTETALALQSEGFAVELVAADRLPQVELPFGRARLRASNPSHTLKERLGG